MPFKCLILFLLLCISLGGHFHAFAVDTDPASLLEAADTVLEKVFRTSSKLPLIYDRKSGRTTIGMI